MRRLADLRCDWFSQYAGEVSLLGSEHYTEARSRAARLDGYLSAVRLAFLTCRRSPEDWSARENPRADLFDLIARHEAEFPGKILAEPADHARFLAEPPDSTAWGVLRVSGLDVFIRSASDLDIIDVLFERGTRIFQYREHSYDESCRSMVLCYVEKLLEIARRSTKGRPVLDVSGMPDGLLAESLELIESRGESARDLPILRVGEELAPNLLERLFRLDALLGWIPDGDASAVERVSAVSSRGIGVATDFLSREIVAPEVGNASRIVAWVVKHFTPESARALLLENALSFAARICRAERSADA